MTRLLVTLDAVGGVWPYAMALGAAARADGMEPVFAGLGPPPSPARCAEARALGRLEWGEAPLDWMADGAEALAPVAGWIEQLARRHEAGLLHLNAPSQAVGLDARLPVVTVSHSCLASWSQVMRGGPAPEWLWHARLVARGLARADVAVAPSAAHAALLARCYGQEGVRVVHNASHGPLAAWSAGAGVVAAARWWDAGKNAAVLDAAAGRCGQQVTMLGPVAGPDGQAVTLRHAHAAGERSHADTLSRLAGAAIFVSPSRYEPFGLAALEAARASRPLVLADIPTYRELWQGAALFFDPADAARLAQLLDALAASPERRRALGEAAHRRAQTYSAAAQAKAMRAIWREARQRGRVAA